MPILNIEGKTVNVDDSFLKLSPDEQNATVDEIAHSIGAAKSSGVSADNVVRSAAQGIPIVGGAVDKLAAGMDALTQPLLGRGSDAGSIGERYAANSAAEKAKTHGFETAHPYVSTAAGLAGGLGALGAVAKTATGARLLGLTGETLPQQALNGAVSGGAMNAADAAVRGEDPMSALQVGGIIGGAAPVVGRAIGAATRGVTSSIGRAVEPFTVAGRETRADRLMAEFAQGGNTTPVASEIAGSLPTTAQATANPGLAGLERHLRNTPGEVGAQFVARDAENAAARDATFRSVSGDKLSLDALREARSSDAAKNLEAAFANKTDANPRGVVRVIDSILAGKEGQRSAVSSSLGEIRNQLVLPNPLEDRISQAAQHIKEGLKTASKANEPQFKLAAQLLRQANKGAISEPDLVRELRRLADKQKVVGPIDNALAVIKQGDRKLQTDPELLYGVRQSAGDKMKFSGSPQQLASGQLIDVQHALDRAISKQAPEYSNYMRTYAEQSRPIDVQSVLQKANVTDASGKITLGKLDSTIKTIEGMQGKAGASPAKSFNSDELGLLRAIRSDLRMSQNTSLGRSVGSNTVQNLLAGAKAEGGGNAVETFLRNQAASLGAGGLAGYGLDLASGHGTPGTGALGGALAGGLLRGKYSAADAKILNQIVEKMLHADQGSKAIGAAMIKALDKRTAEREAKKQMAKNFSIASRAYQANSQQGK